MTQTPPAPDRRDDRPRGFNVRFNAGLNTLLAKLRVEEVPHIRRIIITVVGGTVVIIGAALVFLPGPGMLVILGGLAILGTEYAWARRWMRKAKRMGKQALSQTQKIFSHKEGAPAAGAPLGEAAETAGPGQESLMAGVGEEQAARRE